MEEVGILRRDLSNRRHDWWEVGIFLWEVSTGTRTHVPILCRPGFEPVGASRAASSIGGDLVEMEFDNEVSKAGVNVGAALLGASEKILARGGVVDCHSAVILMMPQKSEA